MSASLQRTKTEETTEAKDADEEAVADDGSDGQAGDQGEAEPVTVSTTASLSFFITNPDLFFFRRSFKRVITMTLILRLPRKRLLLKKMTNEMFEPNKKDK
jgi:hypothetical protein